MALLTADNGWEWVEDDGFLCKRPTREAPVEPAKDQQAQEEEEDDDEEEPEYEELSLQRRKELLLKKKEMYTKELKQWEQLLATQEELTASAVPHTATTITDSPAISVAEAHYERYEQFLHEVQDLEWFIRKYTSFCDRAEYMCKILDEELKNNTVQLPRPRQIFYGTTTDL